MELDIHWEIQLSQEFSQNEVRDKIDLNMKTLYQVHKLLRKKYGDPTLCIMASKQQEYVDDYHMKE